MQAAEIGTRFWRFDKDAKRILLQHRVNILTEASIMSIVMTTHSFHQLLGGVLQVSILTAVLS